MKTTKPVFRIGAAGLDPRDWRLIEIVFKHSQYNRFEFVLAPDSEPDSIDILIANTNDPAGVRAVSAVRNGTRQLPVIAAVPRGAPGAARHAISIDRLTLQLLPILNRVVELELLRAEDVATPKSVAASPAPSGVTATTVVESPLAAQLSPAAAPASPLRVLLDKASPDKASPDKTASDNTAQAQTPPPLAPSSQTSPMPSAAIGASPRLDAAQPPRIPMESMPAVAAQAPKPVMSVSPPSAGARSAPATFASTAVPAAASSAMPVARPTPVADARANTAIPSNLVAFPKPYSFSPPAPQQLRALIVDDSPTVRQQLQGALARMGLATHAVERASEALEMLAREYFDLILVDVVMPDVDGYKLTREIKRDKRFRQIPVIMLTSKASPFDLARGALAGCDSYLTKPVPLKALEKTVLKQLRKSLAIDDLSAMLRPPQPSEPAAPAAASAAASSDVQQFGRR